MKKKQKIVTILLVIVVLGVCIYAYNQGWLHNRTRMIDLIENPVIYIGKEVTVRGTMGFGINDVIGYDNLKYGYLYGDSDDLYSSGLFISVIIPDEVSIPKMYPASNYLVTGIFTYVEEDEYGNLPYSVTGMSVYYILASNIVVDN